MSYNKRHRIVVNSYQHRTNDRFEQNWQRQNDWTTYNLTNDKRLLKCGNRRIETRQWDNDLTMTSPLNWPIRSKTRVNYHRLTRYNSLWLWRWLPHRLSKRQSLSTKVLFRTSSPGRSCSAYLLNDPWAQNFHVVTLMMGYLRDNFEYFCVVIPCLYDPYFDRKYNYGMSLQNSLFV